MATGPEIDRELLRKCRCGCGMTYGEILGKYIFECHGNSDAYASAERVPRAECARRELQARQTSMPMGQNDKAKPPAVPMRFVPVATPKRKR